MTRSLINKTTAVLALAIASIVMTSCTDDIKFTTSHHADSSSATDYQIAYAQPVAVTHSPGVVAANESISSSNPTSNTSSYNGSVSDFEKGFRAGFDQGFASGSANLKEIKEIKAMLEKAIASNAIGSSPQTVPVVKSNPYAVNNSSYPAPTPAPQPKQQKVSYPTSTSNVSKSSNNSWNKSSSSNWKSNNSRSWSSGRNCSNGY